MPEWTPGPWQWIDSRDDPTMGLDAQSTREAQLWSPTADDAILHCRDGQWEIGIPNDVNARLIAESPAMAGLLGRLVAAYKFYDMDGDEHSFADEAEAVAREAQAILARIEGGTEP